ncbi:MAG: hypothetical protein SPF56_03175 [Bacteroidaceae bacterium]|nr:hypothetical protein [Prevotellaceae bacterium]MDY5631489.1 hypothetical protein [Bacteroidaceae bacterium]
MNSNQQIQRAIRKIADKFPASAAAVLTDIHLQVKPQSGELLAFNDDDVELTRVVIEQWIGKDDDFYDTAAEEIREALSELRHDVVNHMNIMHPFYFVLVDEDHETLRDIYLVDDDSLILSGSLLEGLDKDLNSFLDQLMKS